MKSIKWLAAAGMMCVMVACGGVSDDELLKDLEEDEIVDFCEELCEDAESYSLMCEQDGVMITYSSEGDTASCKTNCEMTKSVKDSCEVTAGDLRALNSKPADCAEATSNLAPGIKLAACF